MTENLRLKKIVKWLIGMGYADSDMDLAEKLEYSRSSFSVITNGRVNLSEKFLDRLCKFHPPINRTWILTGHGEMIKEEKLIEQKNLFDLSVVQVGKSEVSSVLLKMKDEWIVIQQNNINFLINKLKELETINAQLEERIRLLTVGKT